MSGDCGNPGSAHVHGASCEAPDEAALLRCLECGLIFESGIADSGADGAQRCPQCGLLNAVEAVAGRYDFVIRRTSRFR